MKLLDTTFLIHYWGGVDATAEYLEKHEEHAFVTTTINLKEIATGRQLQGGFNRNELLTTFDWVSIVPFKIDHAITASILEAELRTNDSVTQANVNALVADMLIAAVAIEKRCPVVTRNTEDFVRLGAAVEPY